jgi:predicted component of type VI protein secretion system
MRSRGVIGCAVVLTAAALGFSCAGRPQAVEACVKITSGTNLHTYDGQPHVVHVYFYALKSSLEFRQMDVQALLAGNETPAGVVEGPLELIVAPDSVVEFREALDPETVELGIVADYFRGPDDPPGRRKGVVKATCGLFRTPKIRLTPADLLVE